MRVMPQQADQDAEYWQAGEKIAIQQLQGMIDDTVRDRASA